MVCLHSIFIIIGTFVAVFHIVEAKEYYEEKGSNITLICPLRKVSPGILQWVYIHANDSLTIYTMDASINTQTVPPELYTRLCVTGNHNIGEYNLQIRDIRESDEGRYRCEIGLLQDFQELYLIVPPSNVSIENVTPPNKLLVNEGRNLTVSCVAIGGKPPPYVTLKFYGTVLATGHQSLTYTLESIIRSYDRKIITCQASNNVNVNNPIIYSAIFYLNLKPLLPTFSPDPVIAEENKLLVVTCTSNGSRPAANFQWTIWSANVTSNTTTNYLNNTADSTYIVTSTLTYSVDRSYNGRILTCGAYNSVPASEIVASTTLNVTFAPDINVTNVTYNQSTSNRNVTCNPDGNPTTYKYKRWQHKSIYGELIRELDVRQDGVLTLPYVSVENRYQDSGEYVCTAGNGIIGRDGNVPQTGSGYVTANAQPVFTNENNNTKYGELGKDVDINIYVYSVPKYISCKWYKSDTALNKAENNNCLEMGAIVHDTFHGTKVQLNGYRVTLTIKNLMDSNFNVNYTVILSNGVGDPVEYTTLLVSASAPETPKNFTAYNPSVSSIVVQWEAGYNGGHEQTFYVEYQKFGSNTWKTEKILNAKQMGIQTYILTGLQDETFYELRMFAANKYNKSSPTQTETIETTKDSQASNKIGGIVGGAVGGLVAVLITIVIIWFLILKRKQHPSTHSKLTRSISDLEVSDGLQHNILYQSAGVDFKPLVPEAKSEQKTQKSNTSDTEYAEVQKPNAVYAAVDKTGQHKNLLEKKQKDKKKRPKKQGKKVDKAGNNNQDAEYANDGLSLKDIGEYLNAEERNGPSTSHANQQTLEYADLSFAKQKGKKSAIHGEENRTLYSEVDHTKKAPPPPQESAYEETNFKSG